MRDLNKIREKVVIRLDNQQVALGIVGFIMVSVVTFTAGVLVGKQMMPDAPEASAASDGTSLKSHKEFKNRDEVLTRVALGTAAVNEELLTPPTDAAASQAANAAMIETHRQLAAVRARGVARSLGPVSVVGPDTPRPAQAPESIVYRNQAKERGAMAAAPTNTTSFALQVSAFSQPGPASVMAEELQKSGHKARIRQVGTPAGGSRYSVEVGRFADARKATHFQRSFERNSGYPTILVPVR
jgi:cell division septation protein DedD